MFTFQMINSPCQLLYHGFRDGWSERESLHTKKNHTPLWQSGIDIRRNPVICYCLHCRHTVNTITPLEKL